MIDLGVCRARLQPDWAGSLLTERTDGIIKIQWTRGRAYISFQRKPFPIRTCVSRNADPRSHRAADASAYGATERLGR